MPDGSENLDPEILRRIEQSEQDGGFFLKDLAMNQIFRVETRNSVYEIALVNQEKSSVAVRGGQYFPKAEVVCLTGSTWGGSMIKMRWIGVGMHLELFRNVQYHPVITTSTIVRISLVNDSELAKWLRLEANAPR